MRRWSGAVGHNAGMEPAPSFAAWLAALNAPRTHGLLAVAVTDDVRIERHAWVPRDAPPRAPVEVFVGLEAVATWLYRLPPRVTFTLVAAPVAVDGRWKVEYALDVADFHGGGHWLADFAADGRLAYLSHRPFPLAVELGGPGPDELAAAASGAPASPAAHPHHDHDHHHG